MTSNWDNWFHNRLWRAKNHHLKKQATADYRRAVKKGRIVSESCAVCGEQKTDGHHEDYAKPFDVIWLCRWHHSRRHQFSEWFEREHGDVLEGVDVKRAGSGDLCSGAPAAASIPSSATAAHPPREVALDTNTTGQDAPSARQSASWPTGGSS